MCLSFEKNRGTTEIIKRIVTIIKSVLNPKAIRINPPERGPSTLNIDETIFANPSSCPRSFLSVDFVKSKW